MVQAGVWEGSQWFHVMAVAMPAFKSVGKNVRIAHRMCDFIQALKRFYDEM